tara:strand:+ start:1302 stop:2336 length:1035 start_codon:yes stop_codon:yes gene_type:complete
MIIKELIKNQKIKRKYPNLFFDKKDKKLFDKDIRYNVPKLYRLISFKNILLNNNFAINLEKIKLIYVGDNLLKVEKSINIFLKILKRLIFFKILKKKNLVILSDKFSSGYFHFICELLPKIEFYKKNELDLSTLILENTIPHNWVKFFISKYNLKFMQHKPYNIIYCNKLNIFSSLGGVGNYRPKYLKLMNKRFTTGVNINIKNQVIFIDRKKTDRDITNKKKLYSFLKKKKILKVYMEDLSLQKQIELAYQARIIIGIHGGGLTNICWMNLKKNNFLIEIRDEKDNYNNCYFNLADALKIKYYFSKATNSKKIKDYSKERLRGKFEVNINQLDFLINKIMKLL